MEKIGSGLQFNVYDFGEDKVLKTFRTRLQMVLTNLIWEPHLIFAPWILNKKINNATEDRKNSIKFLKSHKFKKELLANLSFEEGKIIQDKVIPISEFLKKEEMKKILEDCLLFTLKCWKQGFSEKVYNFHGNHGIDKKGNVVLIDFGELNFSKEEVEKDIISKRWKKASFYFRILNKDLKKYYADKADEILTIENLNKNWKS